MKSTLQLQTLLKRYKLKEKNSAILVVNRRPMINSFRHSQSFYVLTRLIHRKKTTLGLNPDMHIAINSVNFLYAYHQPRWIRAIIFSFANCMRLSDGRLPGRREELALPARKPHMPLARSSCRKLGEWIGIVIISALVPLVIGSSNAIGESEWVRMRTVRETSDLLSLS